MNRVSFVLWDGSLYGGAETATIALCGALKNRGIPVSVVFVGSAGVYEGSLRSQNVTWVSAGYSSGSSALGSPRALARAVKVTEADIVVLPGATFLAPALRLGGYRGRLVAVEHGGILQPPAGAVVRRMFSSLARLVATPMLDAQVAVSDFLLGVLQTQVHASKVIRIHNGVDVKRFAVAGLRRSARRAQDATVVIGAAGKLMKGKGFEDVVEAVGLLESANPWRLEIAGDGPLRAKLAERVCELGVSDRVRFRGWVDDVSGFWSDCDLAIAASNGCVESFGMVVAEALASGIPVVASTSGGLPEVLGTSGAGVIYDSGDVRALAGALERFVDSDEARESAGVLAVKQARCFTIEAAAARYESLFRSLAHGEAADA